MCILFVALGAHPLFPVIIASNRDEFFNRESSPFHQWPNNHNACECTIFAGKDNLRGGTWLALDSAGGFCAITNFREPLAFLQGKSRGFIPTRFAADHLLAHHQQEHRQHILSHHEVVDHICSAMHSDLPEYAGLSVLCGDLRDTSSFRYISNRQAMSGPHVLPHNKNIHPQTSSTTNQCLPTNSVSVLCNSHLDTPWPKVELGRNLFQQILSESTAFHSTSPSTSPSILRTQLVAALFDHLLLNRETVPDSQLPSIGTPIEIERLCCPIFVNGKFYGTRSMMVCVVDQSGMAHVVERSRDVQHKLPPPPAYAIACELAAPTSPDDSWDEVSLSFELPASNCPNATFSKPQYQ